MLQSVEGGGGLRVRDTAPRLPGTSRKGARRALRVLITARQEFHHVQVWEEARHTDKRKISERKSINLGRCL